MREAWDNLLEFHERFSVPIGRVPAEPTPVRVAARWRRIEEEIGELRDAITAGEVSGIAGEIADSIYTLIGAAVEYGIPLVDVWAEVHAANMRKALNDDGDIIKPAGWKAPDVEGVLRDAGWRR